MPVAGFSVGKDVALNINGSTGPIVLSLITSFTARQETTDARVKALDGITRHVIFYDGWSGSFNLERVNHAADDLFAQLEANYYAGLSQVAMTITETIAEVDGSVTQWRYTNVVLKLDDAGDWAGDATVKQRLSFMAARKLKLA